MELNQRFYPLYHTEDTVELMIVTLTNSETEESFIPAAAPFYREISGQYKDQDMLHPLHI